MQADRELQQNVIHELEWDPAVDPTNIQVAVHAGAVTLKGHVQTYAELIAAQRAAARVYGVRAVANDLTVRLLSDQTRDDSDIAQAISNQLAWSARIPKGAVKAVVTEGWVSLEGQVDRIYQSEEAERIVRGLIGVKGVTNRVVVQPLVREKDVMANITAALHRQAQIDARRIWVTSEDGRITLNGQVSSWSEAEAARNAAAAAPGVTKVVSKLTVTP